MEYFAVANLLVFVGLIVGLTRLGGPDITLSRRILHGLAAGVVFGLVLQIVYATSPEIIQTTLTWTNVVGTTYVNLLRMIVMPLVLIMMIAAVVRLGDLAVLGKIGGSIIGILVVTTMIAAVIGILVTDMFGLTMDGLTHGARELARADTLQTRQETIIGLSLADVLVEFVPSNIFYDLTGARPTSIVAVVLFGMMFGVASMLVSRDDAQKSVTIVAGIDTLQAIIMKLVKMVLWLTPYGILALMTNVIASSNGGDVVDLLQFIGASYLAILIMFGVHALLLRSAGIQVFDYFKKVWPVLTFAFSSRSSAATIPLSVEVQIDKLKVPEPTANIAASFGATIGQNGCAGIYPAMLATMIAPTMGIDPLTPGFFFPLIGIVAISSFGIAGVGGGATIAALVVLPAMGLPIALVALLISIEPLIDMARTALNVNGAITAGLLTNRVTKADSRTTEVSQNAA